MSGESAAGGLGDEDALQSEPPWDVECSSSCFWRLCLVRRFWNHTFTCEHRVQSERQMRSSRTSKE